MKITNREFLNVVTPTCHASTMVHYNGEPVYAWFGGTREGRPDSTIFIQFGNSTECYKIGADNIVARWNPVLFTHDERLYIFVKVGAFCDRWQTFIHDITDIRSIETPMDILPVVLPAGLNGPVKTKPIYDKETDLFYCGSSVETMCDWTSYIEVYKFEKGLLEYQHRTKPLVAPKFHYQRNKLGGISTTNGIIQPSLWVDKDRIIHAAFRSSAGLGKIYHAQARLPDTPDDFNGFTWSTPEQIDHLENPNSGIDTIYKDGRLFLIHNPDPIYRVPLVLSELDDDFNIIDQIVISESTEGETHTPELSYPYMVEKDNVIDITYTYGRSQIEHCIVSID